MELKEKHFQMAIQLFISTTTILSRPIQIQKSFTILQKQKQPKQPIQMAFKYSNFQINKLKSTSLMEPKRLCKYKL